MAQVFSIMELSGIFCLVALAAVVTFRFAGFPDLSVDGVFTLGAIVFGQSLIAGASWPLAILLACSAGCVAGMTTALLATKLRIHPLLASVLILTILYSVNLRILGTANRSILQHSEFARLVFGPISLPLLACVLIIAMGFFLKTEVGTGLRATGDYPEFLQSIGRNVDCYRMTLVGGAGVLVSLAGSLMAIRYSFVDVSMGIGTVIIGIAGVIIGEKFCGRLTIWSQLSAAAVGITIYESAVAVALVLGTNPIDVKLATGMLAVILLAMGRDDETILT